MKAKTVILVVLFTLVVTISGYGAVPHFINYQGKAIDKPTGVPLSGTYDIAFTIYDHETSTDPVNLKWTETHSSILITNGIFNVLLGSVTPLDLPFDEDYWIGIKVGTDTEMIPRARLVSVGYAYKAEKADTAAIAATAQAIDTNDVIDAKGGLVIEARDSDPANPVTGQIWLRTDR